MTEKPIIFSSPMVRAILDGRKTQTRRIIQSPRPNHPEFCLEDHGDGWIPFCSDDGESSNCDGMEYQIDCPYGQPGDRLWVRETWALTCSGGWACDPSVLTFRAGGDPPVRRIDADRFAPVGDITQCPDSVPSRWRPSIHMPKWAARLWLEVTGVRVERVQDISEDDAVAEGVERGQVFPKGWNPFAAKLHGNLPPLEPGSYRGAFACLWNELNAKRGYGWDTNPWVWVIEFRRQKS